MSARKILLILGWALVGLSLFPQHESFDDERGRGTRWSVGLPSSPLLVRENIETVSGTHDGAPDAPFQQELNLRLISLSALSLLAGVLLVRAANKQRPSRLPQVVPPAT